MFKKIIIITTMIIALTGCVSSKTTSNSNDKFCDLQHVSPIPVTTEAKTSDAKGTVTNNNQNSKEGGDYIPINYEIQKAVWFSYIDLADMLTNKSEAQFTTNISKAFDKVKELGANTVYVHVRPFGDALYQSAFYPQSRYYNGNSGQNSGYDALDIMINQAHSRGLSIHAWLNPLRCEKPENIKKINNKFLIKQWYTSKDYFNKYLIKVDNSDQLWLNPAYDDVLKLICDGVKEICTNYKIDGIHIDDYFYPTTDQSFDKQAFANSDTTSIDEFRLDNTNSLVKQMYSTVKSVNSRIKFGISPQGNFDNNYEQLYADVKTWISEDGFCDYIVPQVYYGYENKIQPYLEVIEKWNKLTNDNVQLVIGLAFYKIYDDEEFKNDGIIAKQINDAQALDNYGGVAIYNYKNIFSAEKVNKNRMQEEVKKMIKALKE